MCVCVCVYVHSVNPSLVGNSTRNFVHFGGFAIL
jgi:hypothetical protein